MTLRQARRPSWRDPAIEAESADAARILSGLRRSMRASIAANRIGIYASADDMNEGADRWIDNVQDALTDRGHDLGTAWLSSQEKLYGAIPQVLQSYPEYIASYLVAGHYMNRLSATRWRRDGRGAVKLDVLAEIHAQALLVAEEVLVLVRSGYPAGAISRWRTLHELHGVAVLIERAPAALARRYSASHVVELHRRAERGDYDDQWAPAEERATQQRHRTALERRYRQVLRSYGNTIATPYGWAAEYLGIRKPTGAQILARAGLDEKALFAHASQHVHGVRLASVKTLSILPDGRGNYVPRSQSLRAVLFALPQSLNGITLTLAMALHKSQGSAEAVYWAKAMEYFALDAVTETAWEYHLVTPGWVAHRFCAGT